MSVSQNGLSKDLSNSKAADREADLEKLKALKKLIASGKAISESDFYLYYDPLERFGNGIQLVGDQGKYALYDEKGNVLDKLPAIKALTTLINALSQPLDLSPALEQKTNAETGVVKVATGNTVANGNAEKMTVATPDEKIANDLVTVNIGSGVLVAGVKDDEPSEDFLRRIAERKQWQECLALDERRCGLNHMELVPALLNLSNAYLYLGDYNKHGKERNGLTVP